MLPWRLFCLGYPAFVGPDGEPIRLRTRKHLALLIYLAVEPPIPHRRDRLAALLWPRAGIDEGRHSLATALSVLRARLGADAFEAGRDTIRLRPGRVITDLAMLSSGDPLEDDIPAALFLEEFEIPHANDFGNWVDGERARLLPLIHGQLAGRIAAARRAGDVRQMERLADRLERIDPLSEHVARARLESRAMAGDRIGALRGYDRWRAALAEELGAKPSGEVDRMADRLRRRGLDHATHAPQAPVPTEQWQERSFVGRSVEFGACHDQWQAVRGGEARHIMVSGEDGIGKTVLMNRVSTALALEGAAVARVQCYELERELPFGAVGGLVSSLLELPGAGATSPSDLAELGRLVGRVRQRWPSLPAPSDATGEGARLQFTEAVLSLILAVADEQPVVLVVDDMHLADATSLAVLHLILRRLRDTPVLALLSTTEAASGSVTAICRFLDSPGTIRLPLGPLSPVASVELLDALFTGGDDPGPSVRRAILSGAGGVPMILELLVEDWRRRGSDSLALTLSAMTGEDRRHGTAVVAELVTGTLSSLDPDTRAVVDLSAILGQRLNDLSMYTLVDLPIARTMRAMGALTSARLLRDAGSHLEFANEVVRAQCYTAMATPMRRLLHARVADRLVAADGSEAPIGGLEIAWHLVRGDRLQEAVPYLLAGGREAIRRGGPHEADLALSTGLPALTGAARRTAILLLAEALQELGRWHESLVLLETSNEPWDPEEEYLREVLGTLNKRWCGTLNNAQTETELQRVFAIAECAHDPSTRALAISSAVALVSSCRTGGDIARLEALAEALLPRASDTYEEIHLLHAIAWAVASTRGARAALPILERGVEKIDSTGTASSIATRLILATGITHCQAGSYRLALPFMHRSLELAERIDNPVFQANAAAGIALALGRLGDHASQVDWARRSLLCAQKAEWGICALSAAYELGVGLALLGLRSEATAAMDEVEPRFLGDRPDWIVQAWALIRADVFGLSGEARKAARWARRATAGDVGGLLNISFAGPYARWQAELATSDEKRTLIADQEVEGLYRVLPRLDAKDRAEVLAARIRLKSTKASNSREDLRELQEELKNLPSVVGMVLGRLGFECPGTH